MITVDISKDYLELFMAKKDIETMLMNEEEIKEEFTLPEFIQYIKFSTHIYCKTAEQIYPFKIVKGEKETYMFIANVYKIDYKPLYDVLDSIDYDFSNLTHKDKYAAVEEQLLERPYFIINSELYYDLRNK
jgi:hypothetical protein